MARKRKKRSKIPLVIVSAIFIFVLVKVAYRYLPVEVISTRTSFLESSVEGEFIVLRQEKAVAAPYKGRFIKIKSEGDRVAKGTVIGRLEITEGTSLEKKSSITIKAPIAGILSYETDGYEGLCAPETWLQLDLTKLDMLQNLDKEKMKEKNSDGFVEAGEYCYKIVDNLGDCYFYLYGSGAYPEKIKKGNRVKICLDKNNENINGKIIEISRYQGEYGILIDALDCSTVYQSRKIKGEVISYKYEGVVLPEKVLVNKDGQDGVYLYKNGWVNWKETKKTAQFDGKVVLEGLEDNAWVIADPNLVIEGERVFHLNR
ncbi:MAG: HlyD family efflux transporter periplasmic adaptor subunit [Clostridia bacterium]|nr:HlyD family efflux transporter periplasmic adaptor subunit [Clostridia bacterium]MDD4047699.1 HlyD family efflux transporter periplasmic adaptor subunit [Clostridia bacterium]